jgi:hypothetical protein
MEHVETIPSHHIAPPLLETIPSRLLLDLIGREREIFHHIVPLLETIPSRPLLDPIGREKEIRCWPTEDEL